MRYLYYPGCTLHERAREYDTSGRASARALGIHLEEMPDWTCCGTVFPLTTVDLVGLVAPVRTLAEARRQGHDEIVTLCSFCYNVLKRANHAMKNGAAERRRINAYLADEDYPEYSGETEVLHLLEVLRDRLGFDALKERVRRPLEGMRVAPYYGCLLLRPGPEIGMDDPESPAILEDLLGALGCDVVEFPHKVECCGSYIGISAPDVARQVSGEILEMAHQMGADTLALACPLCAYNLGELHPDRVSVLYFTEILARAMEEVPG